MVFLFFADAILIKPTQLPTVTHWTHIDLSPKHHWAHFDLSYPDTHRWAHTGLDYPDTHRWAHTGLGYPETHQWAHTGLSYPDTHHWAHTGLSYNNNRLFMAPHLIRAQSTYKDIRICSLPHTHTITQMPITGFTLGPDTYHWAHTDVGLLLVTQTQKMKKMEIK